MSLSSLSIVIPSYNGRQHLERCLKSVGRHAPAGTQVIVSDDGSTDDTTGWLQASQPWVETIYLPTNRGFSRSVNAGIAHARNEIIELLNNDTEVCAGWAEAALRHFSDPTVGSVAPLVLSMDDPTTVDSAGQRYHICGWGQNRGYRRQLSDAFLHAEDVFGPSASSGFYRRTALEKVGGLSAEFDAYCEDIDLSFRLRWAGYRCIYEPASRVLHKGSGSYGRQPQEVVRLVARNEELVYWSNLPARQLALSCLPHLGFQAIRTLRKLRDGDWPAFLRGKVEALQMWRFVAERRRALTRTAGNVPDLAVSNGLAVVRQGLDWMLRGRNP